MKVLHTTSDLLSRPEASLARTSLPGSWRSRLRAAVSDIADGLVQWRVWWVLASSEIRQRYRRSAIGQFWVTISIAATIGGMGLVFSAIFGQPLNDYLPFLGVGLIVWGFLAGLVNDLAAAFISSEIYLKNYTGARSIAIYRVMARNVLMAGHNLLIVPPLLILCGVSLTWYALLAIPAVCLIILNALWIGLLIGPLCARFRDLPQLIMNITQLAFFLTPIMFRPAQLQERLWVLTHLNPFASFVEIVRAPLLGAMPDLYHWIFACITTLVGFSAALPFYARFRGRILYWL